MRRIFSSAAVLLLAWPSAAQITSEPLAPLSGAAAAPSPLPTLSVPLAPVLTSPAGLSAAPALTAAPAAAAPVAASAPAPAVLAAPALAPAARAPAALLPPAAPLSPEGMPAAAPDEAAGLDAGGEKLDAAFDGRAPPHPLEGLAVTVAPEDFPGGSGAALTLGRTMRALVTKKITAADLPYDTTLRPVRPVSLPDSLERSPRAAVSRVTDVAFASEEHSGSAGLVRLGYLTDGRPVALKAYHLRANQHELDKFMLEETRSAKLISDLGVGPLFHGVWRDADGSWNVVFDIARGDFTGTPVTMRTFHDLETIVARLKAAGVKSFGDLQMYRDENGRLSIIDPGSAASAGPHFSEPDEAGGFATQARMEQLHAAGEADGRRYLQWLFSQRPPAFYALRELIMRRPDAYVKPLKDRYPDYFGTR